MLVPRLPRRATAVLFAGLLSTGAPLGLLLLRFLQGGAPSLAWLRAEVAADRTTYIYISVSTAIVFSLFGYLLGRQADALLEMSETDPLTGLKNFRLLRERLEQEASRASRYNAPLSLLLVDLDGLKEINDRHGHAAGDRALRRVAEAIRGELRAADLGARWGGDEFALLAPNTAEQAATAMAERLRGVIARESGVSAAVGAVTASIGLATLDPSRTERADPWELMKAADDALYEAKRSGRNCVRVRRPRTLTP